MNRRDLLKYVGCVPFLGMIFGKEKEPRVDFKGPLARAREKQGKQVESIGSFVEIQLPPNAIGYIEGSNDIDFKRYKETLIMIKPKPFGRTMIIGIPYHNCRYVRQVAVFNN